MKISRIAASVALLGALTLPVHAQTFLKMDTGSAGSSAHTIATALSNVANTHVEDLAIQITAGQPSTKASVKAANGKTDLFISSAAISHWMAGGERMFKTLEGHKELHANLRGIFAFPVGAYQFVVFEDSGIKTLEDLRGKDVFIGPKNSAANAFGKDVLEGAAGLIAGEDYNAVALDWASMATAFQDRQVVNIMMPTSVPDARIGQIALTNKIRLLDIPDEALKHPKIAKQVSTPGRTLESIAPDAYGDAQTNDAAVNAVGIWVGISTAAHVDEEAIYQLTKAFWENTGDVYETAEWTRAITRETAFKEMNIPLHAGAYRYYQEAGFDVPEAVIPKN